MQTRGEFQVALDITIPYWGSPALMRETVASVLEQSNPDWRLTVVDDAYPDLEISDFMSSITDERVRYLRKEENEGITRNYETCLSLTTEDYLVFLGSDDRLKPNYVETVLRRIKEFPDIDIIQPGVEVIDQHGNVTSPVVDRVKKSIAMPRSNEPIKLSGEKLAASLLGANWLYWPSLIFKRETIKEIPLLREFNLIQDLALVIEITARGGSLLLDPQLCFSYRRHSQSASSATLLNGERFAGEKEYFALAAQHMADLGWSRATRAAKIHWSSRLHAISLLPQGMRESSATARMLLAHAFSIK